MASDPIPPRPDLLHPVPPSAPTNGPPIGATSGLAGRPRATWTWWQGVGVYLLAFLLAGLATLPILSAFDGNEDLANIVASVVATLVIVAVLLGWLWRSHPTWKEILGFPERGRWQREVLASMGFGLLLYPAMVFLVGLVLSLILAAVSGHPVEAPEQVPSGLSAVGVALTALYALVIAPIHEELFFRGILFRGVRDRYGLVPGMLASGIGFGLIHYLDGPWQGAALLMGVMLFNGMALAWWYERRGTIVASVVAHMTFNVIGLTLILTIR